MNQILFATFSICLLALHLAACFALLLWNLVELELALFWTDLKPGHICLNFLHFK